MQIPRRVPYSDASSSFPFLHYAFYNAQGDPHAGLDVVHLWLNRGNCPAAVESTAALIGAVAGDRGGQPSSVTQFQARMAYSMALTRFVNTVVDSHQTGFFAQSISSIAFRIGLPLWLVELRHESTHAELPSLALLRMAAEQSLAWLHDRFWIPLLRSLDEAGPSSSLDAAPVPPNLLAPSRNDEPRAPTADLQSTLLAQIASYRDLQKEIAKDESLRSRRSATVRRSIEQIKRTLGEMAGEQAGDLFVGIDGDEAGEMERAREIVVEALLRPGSLVPLSKKKRPAPSIHPQTSEPVAAPLSAPLIAIWEPLLTNLATSLGRSAFRSHLVASIMAVITGQEPEAAESHSRSFLSCLASWAVWIAAHWEVGGDEGASNPTADAVKACLARPTAAAQMLARALLYDATASSRLPSHLRTLLDKLARMGWDDEILQAAGTGSEDDEDDAEMQEGDEGDSAPITTGFEEDLEEMQLKLRQLREARRAASDGNGAAPEERGPSVALPAGWSLIPEGRFAPRPIGCLEDGSVPRLTLNLAA